MAAPDMNTPVLECNNVSISYYTRAGEIPAVVDFNLKVMPGEAVGIVGESGCGKSTVALAIMQYMGKNGDIVGGEIKFMGRDMRTMSEEELRGYSRVSHFDGLSGTDGVPEPVHADPRTAQRSADLP